MTAGLGLTEGEDGNVRCAWGAGDALYREYHDNEWGVPVTGDEALFEKLCLEGFQAGLSWITVLRKRPAFRASFAHFHIDDVAAFTDADVDRLVADPAIIRHRGKIVSAVNNARRAAEVRDEFGSLAAYVWQWEPLGEPPGLPLPAVTAESTALSRDLKRRGWTFVGPTTVYAFMQAMGLVDDHLAGCWRRPAIEEQRAALARPAARGG
ncbi:MAG TPA: DNA-3-methyladenine glycosylase I [Acidimicrobiales bacterium]|jgi:DNA-3-methyladenine glycosylase I|nr:DNA-3-methyladenine glycosylase I [Acidimicrobiales bacterium]